MTPYLETWDTFGRKCMGACGQTLPWEAFGPRAKGKNGRNSVCRKCKAAEKRDHRQANPEKVRAADRDWERRTRRHVRRTYGITAEQYDQMMEDQKGLCGACGKEPSKRLVVDHCHIQGHVRKLVCDSCNVCMGLAGDDPATLRMLAEYIERHALAVPPTRG